MEKNKINDYLKGKLSKSEDLKVQLWMAAHCEDEILLGQLDEYFSDLDDTDDSRWDDELVALERRLGILHGWNLKKWLTAAAVAVCLIILPASGYLTGVKTASESQTAWIEMNVPKGQTDSLVLSDGTRLNLNSGTKLIYPEVFKGNKREIIVDGEIIADVAETRKSMMVDWTSIPTSTLTCCQ